MKQNVRLLSRIFFIITVFWKSRYQTCRIIFSNLRCVVTHISAHRHVIYIQFRQKETRKYLHLHKLSGKINSFSEPRFKESTKFDKLSPSFHLQSNSTQTPYRILYQTQLSNFHASRHHRYHTRVHRSIDTRIDRGVLAYSRRERERRGREFLDPFSIVTRLMGEGSSVRVFEPVISPTLDSAGKTRPAAGRGTNGDPLRQEAISPCTGDTHYPPDMVKAGNAFKETWTERQKAGEPEGRLSHTLVWYLSISPIF